MNVAVVSLTPIGRQGGCQRFTLDAIQSIRARGDRCEAFAVRESDPAGESAPDRPAPDRAFVHTFDAHGERELAFREVLGLLSGFDAVWVHQYLASELVFDILGAVPESLSLLLTNLGDERVLPQFEERYRPSRNHRFVDAAEFLSVSGHTVKANSIVIRAGIWSDFMGSTNPVEREPGQICTLDGVSANAGLETAILGLPAGCSLVVVGAPQRDAAFLRVVGAAVAGRRVCFTGNVPETRRRSVLAASEILVAAHFPVQAEGGADCADPFASLVLLEALGSDTLPVASDFVPHLELMNSLGLSDFVFPAGRHDLLRNMIDRILAMPVEEVSMRKGKARARIRQSWLWDDYWFRVRQALRLDNMEPEKSDFELRSSVRGVRSAAAGYSVGGHTLNWKAFQF
ncbi:MAG: hypothetical protein SGI92_02555 [Bryobacteraceae bacterium]|nr:hypothetical protein [Bryobacteraceae bacterium]